MPRRTAQDTEATRANLVRVARELFAERGYAAVGTGEIVAAAGVTRGALYHHFNDKRDLFRAVFRTVEAEVVQRVAQAALAVPAPGDRLMVGVRAMLEHGMHTADVRISIVDAPAVLGYEEWRATVEEFSLGLVTETLRQAMTAGELRTAPVEPLAQILLGALTEAGRLLVAGAPREDVEATLEALLEGLRA